MHFPIFDNFKIDWIGISLESVLTLIIVASNSCVLWQGRRSQTKMMVYPPISHNSRVLLVNVTSYKYTKGHFTHEIESP